MRLFPRRERGGHRVGGYRLMTRVRTGGMAEVYLAESPSGRRVALKRILPHLDGDPRFFGSLREEARIGRMLLHPNVVRVTGYGEEDGRGHLVMEFVDGISLGHVRARALLRRDAPPLTVVASLIAQAAAAIDYVHRVGIVHGDVTPPNLLVSLGDRRDPGRAGAGLLKLCDFGVAREEGRPATHPLAGSPAYVAPEQAAGAVGDRRSDVFSLAVCAWELCAGRRLFARSSTEETLAAVRLAEVPPLPALASAPRLRDTLASALARDPARRLPAARDLGDAFLDWIVDHGDGHEAMSRWLGSLDDGGPSVAAASEVTVTAVLHAAH